MVAPERIDSEVLRQHMHGSLHVSDVLEPWHARGARRLHDAGPSRFEWTQRAGDISNGIGPPADCYSTIGRWSGLLLALGELQDALDGIEVVQGHFHRTNSESRTATPEMSSALCNANESTIPLLNSGFTGVMSAVSM
jgi:hypothetical protein